MECVEGVEDGGTSATARSITDTLAPLPSRTIAGAPLLLLLLLVVVVEGVGGAAEERVVLGGC